MKEYDETYDPNWIFIHSLDNDIVDLSQREMYKDADKNLSHLYTITDFTSVSYSFCNTIICDNLLICNLLDYNEFKSDRVTKEQYDSAIETFVIASISHRHPSLKRYYDMFVVPKSIQKAKEMSKYMHEDGLFFKEDEDRYIFSRVEI